MEVEQPSSRDESAGAPEAQSNSHASAMQMEVLAYFAILNIAVGLGSPLGIAAIPINYFLKDNLHLSPVRLAVFSRLSRSRSVLHSCSASSGTDGGAHDGEIDNTCWSADWPPRVCTHG
jgi:hypothetical protein